MISSLSNNKIKNLIKLQKKSKVREEQNAFVIEGIKMFYETPKDSIIEVYLSESFYHENEKSLGDIIKEYQVEIVQDSIFKEVSDTTTPQGILAVVKKPFYEFSTLSQQNDATVIILEELRDPGNLGTIIRTAEGAGVTGVILSKSSVDIYNPKVIRSTMGSIYRMPFVYVEDIKSAILEMKRNNIQIYAAHLKGEKFYDEEVYQGKIGILIGNEANGLTDETAELSDCYVKIPMAGKVESLNAAIAASILMYEVYSQKRVR
ncbi:TrmH family RNA methyltransferase [Anaeromicropila herbilytica]|uniref:RNA methyltransferase n=1 Tax=Anaeromicropila herbilytica TaxID=2785025 RepID=A0A7R7EI99_9FIRM|nr:RNA methyltransferase [Anaeromicropila herbilytica]BCN29695.1 RNA methyltransferase [Anaeromicropila herbilytica]